jgi:hypothetical protein
VEFLVDGVQGQRAGEREREHEREEEGRVAQEGFVSVEAGAGCAWVCGGGGSVGVAVCAWEGAAGRRRWGERDVRAPDGEGDVALAVAVAAEDTRCVVAGVVEGRWACWWCGALA